MKNETRLTPREETDAVSHAETRSENSGFAFSGPEEALRTDRINTPVPNGVSRRLAESIGPETQEPRTTWWQRLFGRGS